MPPRPNLLESTRKSGFTGNLAPLGPNSKATGAPARTADAHATRMSWVYSRPYWPETPAQARPEKTRVAPLNPTWGRKKNHEPRRSRIHEASSCTAWRANRIAALSQETIPAGRKHKSLVMCRSTGIGTSGFRLNFREYFELRKYQIWRVPLLFFGPK